MKIAAFYARVSTNRQEKEATIESQIAEVEEKIKQDGNILGDNLRFIDDGWSGDLLARPALDAMRDSAAEKEFEALYVWDRDRIARKYAYQEIILEELEEQGIKVVDLHASEVKTPEDKILLGFKGLFAEYEKAKIAERMRRGKYFKAKSGKIVHGPAPYGYKYIPKTKDKEGYWIIDGYEANIVRQIFSWVGHDGLTLRKVIKRLEKEKISPRKGKKEYIWRTSTLSRLLRNEAYIGRAYYNKTVAVEPKNPRSNEKYRRIKKSSRTYKPRDEWIPIAVPKIIDKVLFEKVQKQLKKNSKFSKRNRKHAYLLAGLLYCGCGSKMTGEPSGKHRYYRCINRILRHPLPKDCFAKGVNIKRIDGVVWNAIKGLLENPKLVRRQAERWLVKKKNYNQKGRELRRIKKVISNLEAEEARLARAYTQELIPFPTFKKIVKEIKDKKIVLEKQAKKINEGLGKSSQVNLTIEEVYRKVPEILKELLKHEKQFILRELIEKIIVNRERSHATIRGYIPIYQEAQNVKFWSISRDSRTPK